MNVAQPILATLAADPGRLAVCDPDGRKVSRGELLAMIRSAAAHLCAEGLQPGGRVVIQIPNGAEFAVAALSVLLAGGIPVLCEPGIGQAVYLAQMKTAAPSWVLIHPVLLRVHRIPGLVPLLARREIDIPPLLSAIDGIRTMRFSYADIARWMARDHRVEAPLAVPRQPEDEAVLVFTGGTMAAPKGVCLSHGALAQYFEKIRIVLAGQDAEKFLADTPPQMLCALRLGRAAYVTRGRKQRRARHILQLVRDGSVDAYFGSPYIWVAMMDLECQRVPASPRLPASLRTVLLGSAPVTPSFLKSLLSFLHADTRVLCLYGLTEAGPVCLANAARKAAWPVGDDWVGQPISGVDLTIRPLDNPDLSPSAAPKPLIGEVVVHSPALFSGYLGDPVRASGDGLRTGDLGYLHCGPAGPELVLVGRSKDMIIRRSVNLYPGILEPVLLNLSDDRGPLLEECALVGSWNERKQDEDVVLFARVAHGRSDIETTVLVARARVALGPDGAPDRAVIVDCIPRIGRQNKLDRTALKQMAADESFSGGPPVTARPVLPWNFLPAKIPFGWRHFRIKYCLLFRNEPAHGALVVQMALRMALWASAQAAWSLDEVLVPGWRNASMRGPLFILGHQRSGTTFLHRLLARDQTHARALCLHEMLIPATAAQVAIGWVKRMDDALGGIMERGLERLQDRLFGPLNSIHRIRLGEVEEDEFMLWAVFASIMCVNDAPGTVCSEELDELRNFNCWRQTDQARVLGYYRACLLKKIMREPALCSGNPPWIVSKNPAFTHKTGHLLKVFPDARFIYLIRTPLETIPSRLSMIRNIWQLRLPGFFNMNANQVEAIFADSIRNYLAAEHDVVELPEERRQVVRYTDLLRDPRSIIERIYGDFSLPGPDASLLAALHKITTAKRSRVSLHHYELKEFGLTESRVRRELAPVFKRYGF